MATLVPGRISLEKVDASSQLARDVQENGDSPLRRRNGGIFQSTGGVSKAVCTFWRWRKRSLEPAGIANSILVKVIRIAGRHVADVIRPPVAPAASLAGRLGTT